MFCSFRIASTAMLKPMNHSAGAQREGISERRIADSQRHQRRHGKDGDDGAIGHGLRVPHCLAQMPAQVVIAADTFAVDEGLRCGLDAVFRLESIGLRPCGQPMVIDHITLTLQQVLGFQAIGAGVLFHDHPVQGGFPGCGVEHVAVFHVVWFHRLHAV